MYFQGNALSDAVSVVSNSDEQMVYSIPPTQCYGEGCDVFVENKAKFANHIIKAHGGQMRCPIGTCTSLLRPSSLFYHILHIHKNNFDRDSHVTKRLPCPYCNKKHWPRVRQAHIMRCKKQHC